MKRQLDRLKGKRLVTGDPNLMTKDEICINATPNGVEVKEIGTDGKIKDLAGSSSSSEENYDYYILGSKDILGDSMVLLLYNCTRASGYNYGTGGMCSYINCPLAMVMSDTNIDKNYIIVCYDKNSYGKIEKYGQTLDTTIIEDNLNIYDSIVLIYNYLGQNLDRDTVKQMLPLIQSSKEEYYNIVDLDLPKNYKKILEERGYIE